MKDKLKIQYISVTDITEWKDNPKHHNNEAIQKSVETFGVRWPIIVSKPQEKGGKYTIRAGHGRIKAFLKQGLSEVPCLIWDEDNEALMQAFSISDNQLTIAGEWADAKLSEIMQNIELELPDFEFDTMGFEDTDLRELLGEEEPEIIEDEPPEIPVEAISKTGDLWTLGDKHRLLCGDATKEEDIEKLMGGKKADLCLTDPPYGVDEDYSDYNDTMLNLKNLISDFLPIINSNSERSLITTGYNNMWYYPKPSHVLIWYNPAGASRSCWGFNCWQPILAYGKDPYLEKGLGARHDIILNNEISPSDINHPCPKPLKLWAWLIERGSPNKGELILDTFGGSGTTLIASEQLNRICYMMEIDPKYCDVILQRFYNLTQISPVRDDGVKWTSLIKEE